MTKVKWFFAGLIGGALGAFMLDPARGKYRRSLARDKILRARHRAQEISARRLQDIKNRSRGIYAEIFSPTSDLVDDETLMNRVRSEFGRRTRHSKAIQTDVKNGIVTLRGHILSDEVKDVLACVASVHGVKDVINLLEVHRTPERIPSLQGEGPEYFQ